MAFAAFFSLAVLCTCVHGTKLISQQEGGSPSHKITPEEIVKHVLLKKDLDKEISDAKNRVGQATKLTGQKKSKHERSIQNEQDAFNKESQAENAEMQARDQKEQAQATQSAAQKDVEILEGKAAAIVDVEAATEGVNTAETRLGSAKSARTKHLADVKKAGDVQTLAETRVQNAEAAENQASVAASEAELDLQNKRRHHTFAKNVCDTAREKKYPDYLITAYCAPVEGPPPPGMITQAMKDGEDAKQEADDALKAAQKEEDDAVTALAEAKLKKNDLDKQTGNFQAAVDDAETKRAVALIALDKAMEEAHKHFTSQQAIEEAKSENLKAKVAQAKIKLEAAKVAFNQAKAKADRAAKDLEEAEQDSKEATQKKLAAKHELEIAQLQLEMAQSDLRSAQADLDNAKKDARESLAAAKKIEKQAETALTQATQALDSHNKELSVAVDAFEDAHKKLTEAEAHHASKVACQQGSKAALDEARAFRAQAAYWSSHTELLEKEHYWDAEFGPIHLSADKIYSEKSGDYEDAKTKNDKHNDEVAKALKAVQAAQEVKDKASEAKSSLEAKTELLQAAKVNAEGFKNDATLRRTVADAIHKVYHK